MPILLREGDALEVMEGMEGQFDAVITDPPYGLSREPDIMEVLTHWVRGDDYTHSDSGYLGKDWDSFVPGPSVWRQCFRLLKPGAHLAAFAGTRTADLMGISIRLAGFEIRDQFAWIHSQGFPKNRNVGRDAARLGDDRWEGWGTALKPSTEPIILARKPFDGSVAANVVEHGVGAINIDATRIPTTDAFGGGAKATSGFVSGYEHDGWTPGHPGGRHPANVLLDEEAATALDDAARFFFVAKANRHERTLSDGSTNTHPTVKPLDLMRYLVALLVPSGATILDPYCGSGTTLVAAAQHGCAAVGIDLNEVAEGERPYLDIAHQRLTEMGATVRHYKDS